MWAFLFGLVDPISRIVGKIADAKVELAKAQTDKDRIAAQAQVDTLQARRDVLVAESGTKLNGFIRAGFALPFVIYNAKLVIWDKVFGLGRTDGLSDELYHVELACIGFYFLYEVTARVKR